MTDREKLEDLFEVVDSELKQSLNALWDTNYGDQIFENRHYLYHALEIWHTRTKTLQDALEALESQSIEQP